MNNPMVRLCGRITSMQDVLRKKKKNETTVDGKDPANQLVCGYMGVSVNGGTPKTPHF